MNSEQQLFLQLFFLLNCGVFYYAFRACKKKNNAFGEVPLLAPLGGFVWGDFLIFSPFWILTTVLVTFFHSWSLFLLIYSLFWVVRSIGETIYWFNQQFSSICRNKPEDLRGFSLVKNDSIWYVYQIFWQCITVLSLVATLYTSHLWLTSLQ